MLEDKKQLLSLKAKHRLEKATQNVVSQMPKLADT